MDLILKYFPNLTDIQKSHFQELRALYTHWNDKINVISRKDIEALYVRHVLHSLGIAKVQDFNPNATILDVGTGGGFPGIPLAILFPEVHFHLIDSIGKKIKVVTEIANALQLTNVTATQIRAEQVTGDYDFIVSRAVTRMDAFVPWVRSKISKTQNHNRNNGILYLKGGSLLEELAPYKNAKVIPLSDYFSESFFETKSVVYLPLKYRP